MTHFNNNHNYHNSFTYYLMVGLEFKEETNDVLQLEHRTDGAKTWTLQNEDHKYPESFQTWCWRRPVGLIM